VVRRSAFTFLELIFAIVIIAISVISLPTMIQSTSDGVEGNLVQEAIFAASTQLNQAVAANWDENSLVETGPGSLARVIDDGSCQNNSLSLRYRLKVGHIAEPYHRRCLDSNLIGVSSATVTAVDALEDFGGNQVLLNNSGSQAGYKYTYNININITPNASFNGANADIKLIQANISDVDSGTLLTSLRTYSANIGEVDYYKRTY